MPLLLATLLCSAVFGNAFFKFRTGQLNVLNAVIAVTAAYYLAAFVSAKRHDAKMYEKRLRCDRWLWAIFVYGAVVVALSYLGFCAHVGFPISVLFDASYIPRQAYYLFFLPLIILVVSMNSTKDCLEFVKKGRRVAISVGSEANKTSRESD